MLRRMTSMSTKIKRRLCVIILVVVALIAYLVWPVKTISTPENAVQLDLSKTENSDFYIGEENYQTDMENIVYPYLDKFRQTGYFEGYDGNSLYYEQYILDNSKAHIVIAHGYTDAAVKYREMIYYFLNSGYSVSIMEYRGHGNSYRTEDDLCKVTIESFDEYTDDYKIFLNDIVNPKLKDNEKLFMYAHSMGGAVAAMLIEEDSGLFDAAVLSSPMMEILFNGYPTNAVNALTNAINFVGLGDSYILGCGPYDDTYDFDDSSYTSEAKYAYIRNLKMNDIYYQTNGGSFGWLGAAIKATNTIRMNASEYSTDSLLFQAGLDDTVGANGQNEFVKKASNVQLIQVPTSKHNILFATNDVFIPYMNTILDFYANHVE
jgi:lysophospholipase